MKRLRMLVGSSFLLGLVSAIALFVEYLALCDIGKTSTPMLEWYVVGICMMLTTVFVVSALITLGLVGSRFDLWLK